MKRVQGKRQKGIENGKKRADEEKIKTKRVKLCNKV
jgi:hypothetical protein